MAADHLWAFGIPALQLAVCCFKNPAVGFLRTYLVLDAVNEILVAFAKIVYGDQMAYFYAWLAGGFFNHALCGYLLTNIYAVARSRGLPSRRSVVPVYILGGISVIAGFTYAHAALGLVFAPVLRMFLPLDHAISYAIGCMVAMIPFYCKAISSSLPRPVRLAFLGFVVYETAYAGLAGQFVIKQHLDFPHAIDVVYLVSLSIWSIALCSKHPAEVKELLPLTR